MIKNIIGLVIGGMQTAALARKFKQLGLAAAVVVTALIVLQAAFVLAGWTMYLGFTAILSPAWAAAASTGILILLTVLLFLVAYRVARRSPPSPVRQTVAQIPTMGRELTRQYPASTLAGAAVLGAIVALLLRR